MKKFMVALALIATCLALEGVVELTDSNFKELVHS